MSARPTTRQLEYFAALAEHLNFRRAAEACYVTQPTLSAQIQQLEATLGVRLFERDKRHVIPTAAGTALAQRARGALRAIDDLLDAAEGLGEPLAGSLRLGVIPTIAPYLLPAVLMPLRARFPKLKLLVREDSTARLLELLAQGDLDVLLLAREAKLGEVKLLDLFRDPFLLAAPAEHPLAGRKRIQQGDLAGERLILLEDGHWLRDQALSLCSARGAGHPQDFQASSLSTLVQTVAAGAGVTLVPHMALAVEGRAELGLSFVPFPKPTPSRTISLAWRRASSRADEFHLLGEQLVQNVPRAQRLLRAKRT